jgi:hypothetical protein
MKSSEHKLEYNRKYRIENKEHIKEQSKKRYSENKEYFKNWQKNHYQETKDKSKIYRERNKEHIKKVQKEWRLKNKDYIKEKYILNRENEKDRSLKKDFGIDLNEYNKLFEKQNGCCAICGKHQSEFKLALSVDHNHETGKVRELLCHHCNHLLGNAMENLEILQRSIDYLIKWA